MSGLELLALGAVGAAYVDASKGVLDDLHTMRAAGRGMLFARYSEFTGKVNLIYTIEYWANKTPNKLALLYPRPVPGRKAQKGRPQKDLFEMRKYTFRQLYEIVAKYARVLKFDYGVKPGDTVALDSVNKDEYVFVWYALWSLGAKPAFINYNLKDKPLVHCVVAAKSSLVVVDEEVADNVKEVESQLGGVPTVYMTDAFRSKVSAAKPYYSTAAERNPNDQLFDTGMLIYTSGTTGLPKAAVMSWQKCIIGGSSYGAVNRISPKDTIYSAMPLYHSTAAVLGLLCAHYYGASYAVGHKFSTNTFWTQVVLSDATVIQYVGETCRYLLNSPPHPEERNHHVRLAMGNGLRPDVWVKFKERFNIPIIGEFYGATEFPSAITNYQRGEYGVGSCGAYGWLVSNIVGRRRYTIAAVDPDNTSELWRDPKTGLGRRVLVNEPGEMLFKVDAANIKASFQGYTNDEKATKSKIAFDVLAKGDAWVRTGDLLRHDADNKFFFVDRLGDTFRWKSENVSTNEVEEVLASYGDIPQVVVVGVQVPNHEGRAGFAIVEARHGSVDLDKLAKHMLAKLPRYAVPIFIKFVDSITRTGNNKVQKALYRNQKIPGSSNETIYWLRGDTYVPLDLSEWKTVETGKARL